MFKYGFPLAIAIIVALGLFVWFNNHENGIIDHPSGHAVYLQGEACVVNALPEISHQQFVEMTNWCVTNHAQEF